MRRGSARPRGGERAGSGALDDEGLAGLDDAGARLARAVVLLVVGQQRAVLAGARRELPVPRQVRRGGVRVPRQRALRVRLVRLVPLSVVAVFVDGTCKVHAKMKSAAFSESASESRGSPTERKCIAFSSLAFVFAFTLIFVLLR